MAKGGSQWQDRLNALGTALSGYGSALSGNPLYLQNSLLMRQVQQQQREQEDAKRQEQVANIATRSLMTGGSAMSDQNKMGMLRMMAPQAFRSALAQQAIGQLFPQDSAPIISKPGDVARDRKGNVLWENPAAREARRPPAEVELAMFITGGDEKAAREYLARKNQPQRETVVIDGKIVDKNTGELIKDYGVPATNVSPAQKAVDSEFAKTYQEWVTGASTDVAKNLDQLTGAINRLESGRENLTGPLLGKVSPENRAMINSGSVDVQEMVQEVAQRNLRLILGPQFTEREGDRLIARVYNPSLDEKINAKRARVLFNQIQMAAKDKQRASEYFEKKGTLAGYKGSLYTSFGQFERDLDSALGDDSEGFAPAIMLGEENDPLGIRGR